ncbi:MAG: cytidine/deoxycytidylate deaminase family protein [Syntrophaceticus sp.]|nr:cytidine/deoxycytidylate deaminase family protein [Syntrophaceticus sp.]MDD3314287.1 cytidine/deoxycytidylate deaminase family protein [Syntrophaceticus sp.]MDD4359101.1 cytidine/deoxycytidylate deaminase family protein [Syntrophaceticus sp.]MDD4782334.1 cytidine/deoxycytidylate deaminase family protein [Syntrophaceticus sp.]
MTRPGWHEYFMEIAQVVAKRSSCLRRQVGALIVKERQILCTGYNGVPTGVPHCSEVGCMREQLHIPSGERHELCRGLHAEQNAIIQAAYHGVSIKGGAFYITHKPCIMCAKMICNAGIKSVYYQGNYPDQMAADLFRESGVELLCLGDYNMGDDGQSGRNEDKGYHSASLE